MTRFMARKMTKKTRKQSKHLGSLSQLPTPYSKRRGQSETLLDTCMESNTYSNSTDLLLYINASDWLSEDFDNKSQKGVDVYEAGLLKNQIFIYRLI